MKINIKNILDIFQIITNTYLNMGLQGCFFTISTIIVALCIVPLLVNGLPVTREAKEEASKKSTFCSLPWNRKSCEILRRPDARNPTNPYVALPPWPGKSQQVF